MESGARAAGGVDFMLDRASIAAERPHGAAIQRTCSRDTRAARELSGRRNVPRQEGGSVKRDELGPRVNRRVLGAVAVCLAALGAATFFAASSASAPRAAGRNVAASRSS